MLLDSIFSLSTQLNLTEDKIQRKTQTSIIAPITL
jgi:hypothetical protein